MSLYERLYDTSGQHETYTRLTRDTKVALDEIVSKSRQNVGHDAWQGATGFSASTPIEDLSTKSFKVSDILLKDWKGKPAHLSRVSKLALPASERPRQRSSSSSPRRKAGTNIFTSPTCTLSKCVYISAA
jgi:hypothetical protein